jgi:hypothetical protein
MPGEAEDTRHMLFKCSRAEELWAALGLNQFIAEALEEDISGIQALEHLLQRPEVALPNHDQVSLKEMVAVCNNPEHRNNEW